MTRRRRNLLVHHTKRYFNLVGSNYLGYFAKFSYNLNIVYRIKTVGYLLFYTYKENTESSRVESLSSRFHFIKQMWVYIVTKKNVTIFANSQKFAKELRRPGGKNWSLKLHKYFVKCCHRLI